MTLSELLRRRLPRVVLVWKTRQRVCHWFLRPPRMVLVERLARYWGLGSQSRTPPTQGSPRRCCAQHWALLLPLLLCPRPTVRTPAQSLRCCAQHWTLLLPPLLRLRAQPVARTPADPRRRGTQHWTLLLLPLLRPRARPVAWTPAQPRLRHQLLRTAASWPRRVSRRPLWRKPALTSPRTLQQGAPQRQRPLPWLPRGRNARLAEAAEPSSLEASPLQAPTLRLAGGLTAQPLVRVRLPQPSVRQLPQHPAQRGAQSLVPALRLLLPLLLLALLPQTPVRRVASQHPTPPFPPTPRLRVANQRLPAAPRQRAPRLGSTQQRLQRPRPRLPDPCRRHPRWPEPQPCPRVCQPGRSQPPQKPRRPLPGSPYQRVWPHQPAQHPALPCLSPPLCEPPPPQRCPA
mmetsp:Transcript_83/g.248  ORF Transcript_83/g.248 Transcript_83/m.248 type:complete len:402 (-) Transcript_83:2646-3851(-)